MLAQHNLAPTLHAYSELEGAPKAIVMGYLDPSSWMTLSAYWALPNTSRFAGPIRLALNTVLTILLTNGKVHGDLQCPNVMVNVSSTGDLMYVKDESGITRPNIMVVDFDWAGDAGKVFYPLLRNAGITWPGQPGGPIQKGHDKKMVDSWWHNLIFG